MVRERQTSDPGEGHSSGELAGVERGAGGQLRPQGQQPFQQIPEHQGRYPSGGRSGYQGRYPSGGRSGYQGGYPSGGRSGYQFAGGRIRPQGQQQFQQISEHQDGYQSGGRSGYQSGRCGGHTGGRGGRGPPHGGMTHQLPQAHQPQRYYAGPEFQQNGGNHQQYPRGGATPQPVPSRPRSSDLHQAKMLPYKVAPNNSKLPFGSPTESLADDSSSQAPQQPQGGRPPFGGPSRLQYPDLHQAISPYQPPYRSAPSTSKAPFGSPTKYLGDDSSSQAPQQHPSGDAKPQPRGGEPPYGGSTSLSPDLHQAISPYQPTNLSAPTTSKVPFGCPTKSLGDDSSSQESHLSSANVSQLSSSSQKMVPASSTDMRFPLRPGFGTRGRKCTVTANHFFVQLPDKDLHQYDVTIIPEDTPRGLNRAVIKKLENLYKQSHLGGRLPVYDGRKSLYTAGPLPFDLKDFKITLVDEAGDNAGARKREFRVMIKLVARVDLHHLKTDVPHEAVHALNIALSELPTSMSVQFGRSFYSHVFGSKKHLGEGLESWSGFHQSIRPTQTGMSLNIDVSFTAFIEPLPVIEYVAQLLNKRDMSSSQPLSDADHVKIKKAVRGIKVEVTHRGEMRRKYRICGLTSQATWELTFPVDERGTLKSVVEYFHETYKSIIHYTWLPCLLVGNQQRPVYMPMEVCKIVPGQRYSKRLNKGQIAALLRETSQRPQERKTNINKIVDQIDYAKDEYAREFGIEISPVMAHFDARVLPAPQLKYHNSGLDKDCLPHGGVWNMKNKKMVNGGIVNHWICVNFASRVDEYTALGFCQELAKICSNSGMTFQRNPVMLPIRANSNQVESVLKSSFQNAMTRLQGKELDLLIVILPDKNCSIYGDLKRICDTDLGLVSQCCVAEHVLDRQKQYQYLVNLSLKINVKVGGRNTVLADALSRRIPNVSDRSTIIFGADVTHPRPGNDFSPSIAAVVASQDWPEITKYASLASAQTHRQEIIQDMDEMIKDLLTSFRTANGGHLPERIIFYRDGVGEGQFYQVLLFEVSAIRRACASLLPNYQPTITFVVVQKRHHTRLFTNDAKFVDKSGNIPPGTVVDTDICHPTQFDFFLCSHAGIKGTSRPALYHVLWDENEFSADDLQTLTYNLCYTYARCTRSVSIVPAAYYAHLAAFRARCYIESETSDNGSVEGGRAAPGANVNVKPLPALKEKVKRGMFFC